MAATMTTSLSKRPGILQVVKQLQQQPQDDPAVVEAQARAVMAAVAEQGRVNGMRPPGRLSRRDATHLSACLVASLQSAGWLQKAAKAVPVKQAVEAADAVAFLCLSAAAKWIMMVDTGLDFLRAVIRPALGGTAPGVMTWLPWVAEHRLEWLSNRGPAPQFPCDPVASNILAVWVALIAASQQFSSNMVIHPATWLSPPLLRLAHECLLAPLSKHSPTAALLDFTSVAAAAAFNLPAHPQLQQDLTGRPADVVLGATAVQALRLEFWWHCLATCTRRMVQQNALLDTCIPTSEHPCVRQIADDCGPAYIPELVQGVAYTPLSNNSHRLIHVLLLGELWALLPWQLQQLAECGNAAEAAVAAAAPSAAAEAAPSAAAGATAGAAASDAHGNDDGSSSRSGSDCGSEEGYGSSSSSSSEGVVGLLRAPMWRCWDVNLDVLMLPQYQGKAAVSIAAGPVTLQQLRVATCAAYMAMRRYDYASVLLLTLLLQRADPGLRVEFLGSPMGSFLVHLLSGAACSGMQKSLGVGWLMSSTRLAPSLAKERLAAVLNKQPQRELKLTELPAAACMMLSLVWAHLEAGDPAGGWQSPDSTAMLNLRVLASVGAVYDAPQAELECLLSSRVPCSDFRFLPGLAPSLELFVAAERLLRDDSLSAFGLYKAMYPLAVLLHAAIGVWAPWAPSQRSSSSSRGAGVADCPTTTSSGGGGGGGEEGRPACSSSSSSSGDQDGHSASTSSTNSSDSSSCNAGGVCGPGTLQALSSLTVTVASQVRRLVQSADNGDHLDDAELVSRFEKLVYAIRPSSLIAADMMHLVAHQMQHPGADRSGAVKLAAAAHRLTAGCAEAVIRALGMLPRVTCQEQQHQEEQARQQQQQQQSVAGSAAVRDLVHIASISLGNLGTGLLDLARVLGIGPNLTGMDDLVQALCDAANLIIALAESKADSAIEPPAADVEEVAVSAELLCAACRLRMQLVGCSNMDCINLSGSSAEGLVAGRKGVRCGGCRVARYCCHSCQQADWPRHRHVCGRLAAAAAAAAALVKSHAAAGI